MPARYHEGAEKAYLTGRSLIFSDQESPKVQAEKLRMLRKMIKKKYGWSPNARERQPAEWTRFERMAEKRTDQGMRDIKG